LEEKKRKERLVSFSGERDNRARGKKKKKRRGGGRERRNFLLGALKRRGKRNNNLYSPSLGSGGGGGEKKKKRKGGGKKRKSGSVVRWYCPSGEGGLFVDGLSPSLICVSEEEKRKGGGGRGRNSWRSGLRQKERVTRRDLPDARSFRLRNLTQPEGREGKKEGEQRGKGGDGHKALSKGSFPHFPPWSEKKRSK